MAADLNGVTVLLQELDRALENSSNQVETRGRAEAEVQRFVELAASVTGHLGLTLKDALREVSSRDESSKPEPPKSEGAITVPDVAALLHVSKSKVTTMCALGEIPYARLGRRILFKRSEVERWLDAKMVGRPGKK